MFSFEDKDKNEITLRPEMTPTLVRLIMKKGKKLLLPIKWFSIPQCWRFEDIQKGRKREHYQWNMDIVGVSHVSAEAELLAAITTFFQEVGLTSKDVVVRVNNRKILQTILNKLGVDDDNFSKVCIIVDKLDKLDENEVNEQLNALGLSTNVIDTISTTFKAKSLDELKESLKKLEIPDDIDGIKDIEILFELAKAYGYDDYLCFDPSIVRGLAYYTGTVFEAFDRKRQFRAICGGGRYDRLFSLYGSKEVVPCAGFGFGDCVIVELLKEKKLLPKFESVIDDIVVPYDESFRPQAYQIVKKLRDKGRRVEIQMIPKKKIAWCYNYADRIGADRLIFVAPDEWKEGKVRIKNLRQDKDAEDKEFNVPVEEL